MDIYRLELNGRSAKIPRIGMVVVA